MILEFKAIVKKIKQKEKHINIYVESNYGKSIVIQYSKAGTLPIKKELITINSNFPMNLLQSFLDQEVNIKANLIKSPGFNYLKLKEINVV